MSVPNKNAHTEHTRYPEYRENEKGGYHLGEGSYSSRIIISEQSALVVVLELDLACCRTSYFEKRTRLR